VVHQHLDFAKVNAWIFDAGIVMARSLPPGHAVRKEWDRELKRVPMLKESEHFPKLLAILEEAIGHALAAPDEAIDVAPLKDDELADLLIRELYDLRDQPGGGFLNLIALAYGQDNSTQLTRVARNLNRLGLLDHYTETTGGSLAYISPEGVSLIEHLGKDQSVTGHFHKQASSKGDVQRTAESGGERQTMKMVKVLFLSANPDGTSQLKLDEENRAILEKIRASHHRDAVAFVSRWAVRPDDLLQYLNEEMPDVVHFSGHGSASAEIVLTDDSGSQNPVSSAALVRLFKTLAGDIKVVVLNSCFSYDQAKVISTIIDCTIGMKASISDKAAIAFAASFYRAIGFGRSVKNAFDQACTCLALEGTNEEDIPQLLVRSAVDASEVILLNPR
jgi:hypothetical protein